ncbi:MAG: GTPase RsgA, partial [Fibrobacterota bacterium]
MQKTGIITEERKNYYTVSCHDGSQYNALLKGVIRRKHRRLFVGDAADIEIFRDELDEKAVIRNVHTRRNKLERPPVANIDQVLLVCCIREPVVDTRYIDRFLFNASRLSVPVSLIFNKKDLLTEEDRNELAFYKE